MNIDDHSGDLVVTLVHDGDHFLVDRPLPLRIDHADPHIRIVPELLDEIVKSEHPNATIDGDVLRVEGINRTVEYRVGEAVVDGFGHRFYLADRIDP